MDEPPEADSDLVRRIQAADTAAWEHLIEKYHGRLLSFVQSRIGVWQTSEDIVQETLIGFLTSLPNFDRRRSLESYLFSICAHKLTDHLRREGRRPVLGSVVTGVTSGGNWDLEDDARGADSILASGEIRRLEEDALVSILQAEVARWRSRGDWDRIRCVELLFVRGWTNKDVATALKLSEQQIANYKFEFIARLRQNLRKQCREAFPELFEEDESSA